MVNRADILVVGLGCGGLFAAQALLDAGYTVLLIGRPVIDRHASSRNFGWLHSGAIEAIARKYDYARQCGEGARLIESQFPEAVHRRLVPSGLFLFDDERRAEEFAGECETNGLFERPTVSKASDYIAGDKHIACVTPDTVFSPSVVMRALGRKVLSHPNARFIAHESPERLEVRDDGEGVSVSDDGRVVAVGGVMVQTLGVRARTLLTAPSLTLSQRVVTRYTPFVSTQIMTNHVIAGPFRTVPRKASIYVVPHPEAGRSILMTSGLLESEHELNPDLSPDSDTARREFSLIRPHFPWLPEQLRGELYVCHRFKLDRSLVSSGGKLIGFYPGYFGNGPAAAPELLSYLQGAGTKSPNSDDARSVVLLDVHPMHYMMTLDRESL